MVYARSHIFVFLFSAIFFGSLKICGQNDRFIDPYFENYTTADRLPFDKFNDGLIDEHGFLWLSSVHGIVKYDGYEFKAFRNNIGEDDALVDGRILDIEIDRKGYMWIGATAGLSRWDRKTGEIIHLLRNKEKYPIKGQASGTITNGPNGDVWVSSKHYLSRIDVDDLSVQSFDIRSHFSLAETSFSSNKISWDKKDPNIIWCGSDYGLLKFNIEQGNYQYFLTPFFVQNKDKLGLAYDFHTYVYADSSGTIYTGRLDKSTGLSRNEGMHAFNPETETWRVIKLPPENRTQSVYGISYKSADELWVKTVNHGLGIFNKNSESFLFIDHDPEDKNTIRRNSTRVFVLDSMQNLFIGTVEALSISYQQRNIFKYQRLLSEQLVKKWPSIYIKDLIETDSTFYIATSYGGGLIILNKKTGSYKEVPLSIENTAYGNTARELIRDHKGLIYLATNTGLKVYDETTGEISDFETINGKRLVLKNPIIHKVIEDGRNQIWLGSEYEGLIKITANRDSIVIYNHDELKHNSFVENAQTRGLEEDSKGRIWAATTLGISCFDQDDNEFTNYSALEKGDQYLSTNNGFNCLTDTMGRIWIGTYYLMCIDESKPIGQRQEVVTVKDGLPGSYNRTMQRNSDGTFWIITDNGLVHFNPYDHTMQTYTTKEGLNFDQMWNHNFYFSEDGDVRIFSKTGYFEYQSEVEKAMVKPNLAFTGFEIKGQEVDGFKEINEADTIFLGYKQNFIAFRYAMLNFAPKMDNIYTYKLEGLDDDWVDAGKRTFAQYTDLEGGHYTFKVKAKDKLGNEAKKILSKVIFIATPFWKTMWFKFLVAAFVFLLIYLFYQYRLKTVRKEKLLLARLAENEMIALRAQMNPHFLFNTINSIKRFIIKNETTIAADHLTKFSRLVRLILNNSNSRSIPLADELEALKLYIEMELMRFDDKFSYLITIDDELDLENIEIPPMLMQPFVENAIWHGIMHKVDDYGELNIRISKEDGYLECAIQDNGVGREKAAEIKSKSATKKKSLGMTLTQRRIELLDQFSKDKIINLEIKDLLNSDGSAAGTKVLVRIPIENDKQMKL